MSMKTNKKNRWVGLALAALFVAGGVVAMPQAASAATVTTNSTTCTSHASTCSKTKTARHGLIVFNATDPWMNKHSQRYTVKTDSGRMLCSGSITVNGGARQCLTGSHRGNVKVTISKQESRSIRISATS
ncbi:hypothetical protein ACIQTT_12235 [Microbacterium sp. NPDC090225]|uniref:hypothetical protein n=1 Tax=Microbacterium sp. NPDC090225 TaxID=3364207 RepID=UPI003825EC13